MTTIRVRGDAVRRGDRIDLGQLVKTVDGVKALANGRLAFRFVGFAHDYRGQEDDGVDPASLFEVWRPDA